MFVTGAGMGVASGLPTFRGVDGHWTKDGKEAEDIATMKFF
jgi:NAD-dependent SIR2 family protein deacetylase